MNKLFTTLVLMGFAVTLMTAQIKVVAPNGDVMIGDGTPTEKLHVTGNIALSNDSGISNFIHGPADDTQRITMSTAATGTTSYAFFGMKGSELAANGGVPATRGQCTLAGRYIDLKYNCAPGNLGTFGLRINANGRVGIGTTAPTEQLHVAGNIFASGSVITSDRRLKSNINKFTDGLPEIMKIKPVSYNYNGKASISSDRTHVGIIAQEFSKIAPYAVKEFTHIVHNDDNEVILEEEYLAVDANVIQYMLVNAVQEQQAMLEEKQNEIDALALRLEKLENYINSQPSQGEVVNVTIGNNKVTLLQNEPNPFTEFTAIRYELPQSYSKAQIIIHDMNGKVIETVNIGEQRVGVLNVKSSNLTEGTYTYSLLVDGEVLETKKMILSK